MQRKIKFRAWWKEEKAMFYSELQGMEQHEAIARWLTYLNDYEVMQYTGLKDKNGKEIYEGDVAKWFDMNGEVHSEVKFLDGAFRLGYSGLTLSFLIGADLEVIGNVFENPEAEPSDNVTKI